MLTEMAGKMNAGVLPKNLRSLTLDGGSFVIEDGVLPIGLETLILAGDWTLRPENVLSRCQAIVKLVLHPSTGYEAMDHSMYPPNLETLVLGPLNKVFFQDVGVLPEGLTHLELVDVDFEMVHLEFIGFPQSLQYVKISMHAFGLDATPAVDFLNSRRPDILVEVGSTEYCDVFVNVHPP